jgi:hypothetical protein
MKTLGKLGLALCLATSFSYANTWKAKLMDASCYDNRKAVRGSHEKIAEACAPTASTTDFAIRTSAGKVYKVDSESNSKLAADIQNGVLKKDKDGDIHAMVTGKLKAGMVKVNSVVVDPRPE